MGFEDSMKAAASAAKRAADRAMRKYRQGLVTDEDDLTGVLVGALDSEFDGAIDGLTWSTSILRHRKGKAAEESAIGADMVIHVKMNTPIQTYSKGVIVQAKRSERGALMGSKEHGELIAQCKKMLNVTPASFVFDYAKSGMRCGSASKISGSTNRELYDACSWTAYRFFLELFRCPIGDPNLTSAQVKKLPVPTVIELTGTGDLQSE